MRRLLIISLILAGCSTPTATRIRTPEAIRTPVASSTPGATETVTPGNMLVNPCFDGEHNGDPTYWQQTAGWDVSAIKNPCGSNGTAARINDPEQHGEYQLGDDERIWQVVDGAGPSLTAEIACVHHSSTVFADTNIYGGASGDGPWLLVWTPFTKETCSKNQWGGVQHAETVLPVAFPFYKFELAAMYTEEIGAVKFTSAYFRSE